jgi:hypothetical protein
VGAGSHLKKIHGYSRYSDTALSLVGSTAVRLYGTIYEYMYETVRRMYRVQPYEYGTAVAIVLSSGTPDVYTRRYPGTRVLKGRAALPWCSYRGATAAEDTLRRT